MRKLLLRFLAFTSCGSENKEVMLQSKNGEKLIKLKLSIVMCFMFSGLQLVKAQDFEWAKNIGSSSNDYAESIAVDNLGNVYTTGYFQGTADFDPSTNVFNLTSAGSYDIFISKLDASGNFVWAKQIGGIGYDRAKAITIDNLGNVYITGYFGGTVDFDPSSNVFNLTSAGNRDGFVCKIDSIGNFVWAKQFSSPFDIYSNSITVDVSGNVYTTGSFEGTTDFDPGTGVYNMVSVGNTDIGDIFVSKLDNSGNFVWAKQFGGVDEDQGLSIKVDTLGNVFTTGLFESTADFDPSTNTFNLNSWGSTEVFISKLDASGDFVWAKQFNGTNTDTGYSLALGASGNIYIAGEFMGTTDFDTGSGVFNLTPLGSVDAYVAKLNNNGDFVWAKQIGGTGFDRAHALALDSEENVFTTGRFVGTVDFDPNATILNLTSNGNDDIFISKLDTNGNYLWAQNFGSTASDIGYSIAIDASDNVYSTGTFFGTVDFDFGVTTDNLTSNGGFDIYINKISQMSLGVTDYDFIKNITIYPNPATSFLNISYEFPIEKIEIYNSLGKKILECNSSTIDVHGLNSGIYFLKIYTENKIGIRKIIKQ